MEMIDFRSDTVTKPTVAMRRAMYAAEVGDDARGEDPTVRRLEELATALLKKEAAVFVSSGTMGNLVSVLAHCGRGDEIVVGETSHLFRNELGGVSALGGVFVRTVPDVDGTPAGVDVASAIRETGASFPKSRVLCLENTHNQASGAAFGPSEGTQLAEVAHFRGALAHLDGARLFNAAVALRVSAAELAEPMDSVTVCLSKGLGAPSGSLVCGSREFALRARAYRKMVGGAMRQIGIIAAAGIVAIETMVDRLVEDHDRARKLAEGLAEIDGLRVRVPNVQTNIVMFDVTQDRTQKTIDQLADAGILCMAAGETTIRMVTHHEINDIHIERALRIMSGVMAGGRRSPRLGNSRESV